MRTDPEKINRKLIKKQRIVRVAAGKEKADLVLKNATYLNVFSNEFCFGDIAVAEGLIVGMGEYSGAVEYDMSDRIVLPGFIDAHIHLESTLVSPAEFARAVLPHGTTTVIVDPHEIANVMGTEGIDYMLAACEGLPIDVHFMLPSCVPATPQDESGATLGWEALDPYFEHKRVLGLAEMMNYVGVAAAQAEPIEKIVLSQAHHKKIDGHAPGLSGKALNAYVAAGVYSDHECSTLENALEKLRLGQFIMIREGTAARNLRALLPLLNQQRMDRCMFCSDDKHPNDLLHGGHIDFIIRNAISMGVDPVVATKVASHSAARYFLMNNKGAIAPGYLADFAVIDNFRDFRVCQVFKKGKLVCDGQALPFDPPKIDSRLEARARDTFHVAPVSAATFAVDAPLGVIELVPGEILTRNGGRAETADPAADVLKIAVVERHHATGHVGLGFIRGYGLQRGAVATSVAHDSHNIICVGASDADMAFAVNRVVDNHGGIVVVCDGKVVAELALPVAGLVSDLPLGDVDARLEQAKDAAYALGVSRGIDPFMTLSFISLPVIPELRLTTHGMLDVATQQYI